MPRRSPARWHRRAASRRNAPRISSTVTFAAVRADGEPAPDLKDADISIKIDGRQRQIRSLQLVSLADSGPAAVAAAETVRVPPPFGANSTSEAGRSLVLALDDDSFKAGQEQALRRAVDGLIARLSPRDRISLVTMPYGGIKVPPTTDHSRVRTALSVIAGRGSRSDDRFRARLPHAPDARVAGAVSVDAERT